MRLIDDCLYILHIITYALGKSPASIFLSTKSSPGGYPSDFEFYEDQDFYHQTSEFFLRNAAHGVQQVGILFLIYDLSVGLFCLPDCHTVGGTNLPTKLNSILLSKV